MKIIKSILQKYSFIFFIILTAFLIYKFNLLTIIKKASFFEFLLLVFIGLLILLCLTIQFLITLRLFDKQINLWDGWVLTSLNSYFNNLFPAKAGTIFKGIILKNKFGLKYSRFFSIVFITNSLLLIINTSIFLLLSAIFDVVHKSAVTFFAIVLAILIFLITKFYSKFTVFLPDRFNHKYSFPVIDGMKYFFRGRNTLLSIALINLLILLLSALRLFFCFSFISNNSNYLLSLYMQVIASISFLFSITPSNFFVREAIIIGVGNLFNIDLATTITAAILDRSASLITIIISSAISTPHFRKYFSVESVDNN